jgi:hypothetical protein
MSDAATPSAPARPYVHVPDTVSEQAQAIRARQKMRAFLHQHFKV